LMRVLEWFVIYRGILGVLLFIGAATGWLCEPS
jgi:hypothetical protein